jgi:hypothetical protein
MVRSFSKRSVAAVAVVALSGCAGAAEPSAEPAAVSSQLSDSERCAVTRDEGGGLSAAVDALRGVTATTWEGTELLLRTSLSRYVAPLEEAEHTGLRAAHPSGVDLLHRLPALESQPHQSRQDWIRDTLQLSVDVATHCLAVAEGS